LGRPFGQVACGLPTQRVAGAGDHKAGDGGNNSPVKGGKRPACGLVPARLRG
jgi:hypothetical protein